MHRETAVSETGLKSISAAIVSASGSFALGVINLGGNRESALLTGLIATGVIAMGIYEWRQLLKRP